MGHLQRVRKVGFTRKTKLALMNFGRIDISLFHKAYIRFGVITKKLSGDII
jgi:hypothetical protein